MNIDDENLVMVLCKQGKTVVINNDIHITILGLHGNQVRVGINSNRKLVIERLKGSKNL